MGINSGIIVLYAIIYTILKVVGVTALVIFTAWGLKKILWDRKRTKNEQEGTNFAMAPIWAST